MNDNLACSLAFPKDCVCLCCMRREGRRVVAEKQRRMAPAHAMYLHTINLLVSRRITPERRPSWRRDSNKIRRKFEQVIKDERKLSLLEDPLTRSD